MRRHLSRIRSLARCERGFTLIELLVVIIVLGLLVGLVGSRLFGRVGQSKQAAARAQIELFGAALDQYRLDVGGYPTGAQGLGALVRNPKRRELERTVSKEGRPRTHGAIPTNTAVVPGNTVSTTSGPKARTVLHAARARTPM